MSSSSSSMTLSAPCGPSSDSLVHGLNFGKKIYFEDGGCGGGSSVKQVPVLSTPMNSSVSAAKKVRSVGAPAAAQQAARCQVEGCNVDLSGAKAYYCRHKVCGMHSKAPKVIVGGLEQRFCQQCSRFHQLPEFDQGKRSCRRRLADHNERRRKPPPGTLASRNGFLSPTFHEEGSRFRGFIMDFAHPKIPPGTMHHTWQIGQTNNHDQVPDSNWNIRARGASPANFVPQVDHRLCMHSSSGGSLFASPQVPLQQCASGGSNTSCALSLLSTEPWSRNNASSTRSHQAAMSFISSNLDRDEIDQPAVTSNCIPNSCGFKLHEGSSISTNSIARLVGFGHVSHPGNGGFSGELELALQGNREETPFDPSRTCEHSGSMYHWSL